MQEKGDRQVCAGLWWKSRDQRADSKDWSGGRTPELEPLVKKGNNVFTGNVRGQTGGALGNFQVTLTHALCHVREIGKWPSWVWLSG